MQHFSPNYYTRLTDVPIPQYRRHKYERSTPWRIQKYCLFVYVILQANINIRLPWSPQVEVIKILQCDAKFLIHFLLQSVMSENRDTYAVGAYCSIFPLLIPTWYTIFYINYLKLSSSTCFERHPLIFRRSTMLIVHVCSLWYSHSLQVAVLCTC